jgi:hypothetical protein
LSILHQISQTQWLSNAVNAYNQLMVTAEATDGCCIISF